MFVLAKIVDGLAYPPNLVFLLLIVGGTLLFGRYARAGRRVIVSVLAITAFVALAPVNAVLSTVLESRFPPPAVEPDHLDGIVVLGGDFGRLRGMVEVARKHPGARIIYSGGTGNIFGQGDKEAAAVNALLTEIGSDIRHRVVFEPNARNTRENALFAKELMHPRKGETWMVVTAAYHMPRAVGAFTAVGWPVIAYPVDFHKPWHPLRQFNPFGELHGFGAIVHEILGLIQYRILGWSDQMFPRAE